MYYNYKNNLREKMLLELNDKNIKDLIDIEEKCFKNNEKNASHVSSKT